MLDDVLLASWNNLPRAAQKTAPSVKREHQRAFREAATEATKQ